MRFVDGQSDLHTGGAMPIAGRPPEPSDVGGAIVASRVNGIAPMGVFLDGGQTGFVTTRPRHELRFKWRFPDRGSYGSLSPDHPWGRAKQVAYGPSAAFVFTTPGTHVVTLEVTDGQKTAVRTQVIEVADPDLLFAGPQTYAISSGGASGAPAGAVAVPSLAAARADAGAFGRRNVRFLFARGQSHDLSAGAGIFAAGDFDSMHFGAFGSGDMPILTGGGLRTEGDVFSGSVAIQGLDLRGGFDPVSGTGAGSAGDGLDLRMAATHCVTGCAITGFDTGLRTEAGLSDVFVSDCRITGWSSEGVVFDDGDKLALVGSQVVPVAGTDPAAVSGGPGRIEGAAPGRAVLWQNDLRSVNDAPCWRWNADGAELAAGVIGACLMQGGSPVLELAPSNPGGLDRRGDLVVERCYLLGGARTGAAGAVKLTFGGTTLRNCIAVLPDIAPAAGVDAPAFVTGPAPQTNAANDAAPVRIHNNSFIDLRSAATLAVPGTAFAQVAAGDFAHWLDLEVANQLEHAPALQAPLTQHAPFEDALLFTPGEAGVPASSAASWLPLAKPGSEDSAGAGTVAIDDFGGTLRGPVAEVGAREIPGTLALHAGGAGGILGAGLQAGIASFQITAPAERAGTYALDVSAIRQGPVQLRAPEIAGVMEVGQTVSATPSVVAWDPSLGRPVATYQWLRGPDELPGETGLTHVVAPEDIALGLFLREVVANAGGTVLDNTVTLIETPFIPRAVFVPFGTSLFGNFGLGPAVTDKLLLFTSLVYQGAAARICAGDNGGFLFSLDASGDLIIRPLLSDGSRPFIKATIGVAAGQLLALLVGFDHSAGRLQVYAKIENGPWIAAINQVSPYAGTHFNLSNVPCYFFHFGEFVHYRSAIYIPGTLPDLSSASVRDLFVTADGTVLDPEPQTALLGQPTIDIYGDAARLQSGEHAGTQPTFDTVNGSFSDV